jgi:hypothetical protein
LNVVGWPQRYAAIELPGMISAGGDTFTQFSGWPFPAARHQGASRSGGGGCASATSCRGAHRRGGHFEALFRFYGPTPSLYDHTWRLPDMEQIPAAR